MPETRRGVASQKFGLAIAILVLAAAEVAAAAPRRPPPVARAPKSLRAGVARFGRRVAALLAGAQARKAYWGVLVADATTGQTLYALHADRYFIPASNAKLFTAALALATLGPAYRFRTTLETAGGMDATGRLDGDLVLVGRGDPDLSNRVFPYLKKEEFEGPPEKALAELADAAVARGIREIRGDIVTDASYFTDEPYPPGWTLDDLVARYGAAVGAIAVNDNSLDVELDPGAAAGLPASLTVEPWPDSYQFINGVTTGARDSEAKLSVRRDPGSREVILEGVLPLDSRAEEVHVGVDHPAQYAAELLKRLLVERGVRVDGVARARHIPPPSGTRRTVLAEHLSPPLFEEIRFLLKTSQNLHAEMLLRAAARVATGEGSTEAGLKLEQRFLAGIGVPPEQAQLKDGSGLSRYDLVTPEAVVALLRGAAKESWGGVFRDALPVAGEDGTLADRMKDTPARGRIAAKTGSLDHVHALSGYATTLSGLPVVFAIFGNNEPARGPEASQALDAIATAMVEEIGVRRRKRRR
jgi:serine-type D-Ala-D-Ala carboxypeptidase/endopeptidase (penicillin-binding protein 4)